MRRSLLRGVLLLGVMGLVLGVMGAAGATRGSDGRTNGFGLTRTDRGEQVGCEIEDPNGNQVNVVSTTDYGDLSYFLRYLAGGEAATRVTFTLRPMFEGSPLAGQTQVFVNTGFDNIHTPFGVPIWGGNLTSGPWALRVSNNLGESAVCRFEVVP